MVNSYESIFIINPNLEEEATKAVVEKFKGLIETTGKIDSIEEWGKRKLAYPINKINEGYYVLINFNADSSFAHELERVYKITDDVIKYIVLRKDE
ncbi:MAG: 30S ribosomal protein S6 [Deltaproteobacteria bacterium]